MLPRREKMLKISNIRLETGEEITKRVIAKSNHILESDIISFKLCKKSIDARKKNDIHYNCAVIAELKNEKRFKNAKNISKYKELKLEIPQIKNAKRPVIIGCGPAGLFSALYLSYAGLKPILIERGSDVDKRIEAVNDFWNNGVFDAKTNVQFGEGGAGTFSDGKLTTGVNDERMEFIKEQLVKFGAPEEIMYLSKPHIGTDKLCVTVKNIRNEIIRLGGEIKFDTKMIDFTIDNDCISSVIYEENGETKSLDCENLILAIGHSARDTFRMLKSKGVRMERKTFSIGGRIEHLQKDVGYSQYGEIYDKLPPADYKLSVRTKDDRGVYTFCMCPGGMVVASASEEGTVVTNGMSYFSRDNVNANSALLVTVNPCDIEGDDVLGGVDLQKSIEEKAFLVGGENYFAPVQKVGDFLNDKKSFELGKVKPSYMPGTTFAEIKDILPRFIVDAMKEAIVLLDKKMKGFADPDAILTVPETRSSSPVRILRDVQSLEADIKGLYPCGEGAGYAGGIMSAALDGIRCAQKIIKKYT